MPRSLWVIEVLQPKWKAEGMEWTPAYWHATKKQADADMQVEKLVNGTTARVRKWTRQGR